MNRHALPSPELRKLVFTKSSLKAPVKPDYHDVAGYAGTGAGAGIAAGLTLALISHFGKKGVSIVKRLVHRRQPMPDVVATAQPQVPVTKKPGNGNGGTISEKPNGPTQSNHLPKGVPRPPSERQSNIRRRLKLAHAISALSEKEGLNMRPDEISHVVEKAYGEKIGPEETTQLRRLLPQVRHSGNSNQNHLAAREKDPAFHGLSPVPFADMRRVLSSLGFTALPRTGTGHEYFEGRHQISQNRVKIPLLAHKPGEKTIPVGMLRETLREIGLTPQEFERLRRGEKK